MHGKQKVTLYMPDDLYRQLKIRAAADGEPMSTLAEQALDSFVSGSEDFDKSSTNSEAGASETSAHEKQKVTLNVPDDLRQQLKIRAAADGEPTSALAEQAIRFYLSLSNDIEVSKTTFDVPTSDEHFNSSYLRLTVPVNQNVSADVIASELATLCKALNAYHIACGGSGLEIDDWETLVAVRELVGA